MKIVVNSATSNWITCWCCSGHGLVRMNYRPGEVTAATTGWRYVMCAECGGTGGKFRW